MAIDHSPASKPSGKWRKNLKKSISKEEMKMALVAKRLAMLQDDDQIHKPVPVGCSKQLERTNCVSDCIQDLSSDSDIEVVFCPSATLGKHGSRKRTMVVISDDESEHDGILHRLIQPTKKKRTTKCENPTRKDSLASTNVVAFDKPRKHSIDKLVKKTDESTSELSPVMERAKEIQENVSAEHPSFIRGMKPSQVAGGFWLGLPRKVCDALLPIYDCDVILIDEDGQKFTVKFLYAKKGFSAGWRGFSIKHNLSERDGVIFHKVAPATFQVYIVRKDSQDIVDGALTLLSLDCVAGHDIAETDDQIRAREALNAKVNLPGNDVSPSNSDLGSEVLNGICLSDSDVKFEAVREFKDFKIIIDGLVYDSNFSDANRKKYYELCCSQNVLLHEQLIKGMNCQVVAGTILETINIADAVRACTASTPIQHLQLWEQTLTGLKCLGMKVDFLQAKLNQLLAVVSTFDNAHMLGKYNHEQSAVKEKMIALENQLTELRQLTEKIDQSMEDEMTRSAQRHEASIKEVTVTPW